MINQSIYVVVLKALRDACSYIIVFFFQIWKETFKGLNTSGDKQPVLLTEPACVSKSDREKTTEIMFEYFNTPSMYLADQCILSLYASGKMEGIVLGSGYGLTQVVPCHKGNLVPNSNLRVELAGQDLTDYLGQILAKQNVSSETLRNIKEKLCYVALDYETETQTAAGGDTLNKTYTLPDGQNVIVGKERFQCPEVLFKPSLVGNQSDSVAKLICDGIAKCSGETGMETTTLYKNIVVAGGSSLFSGMIERVQKEVQALAPAETTVDVMAAPGGTSSSFIGGSILTCLQDFHPMWVERKHYDESGPGIVHTKCV